jgi:hypothetical protein
MLMQSTNTHALSAKSRSAELFFGNGHYPSNIVAVERAAAGSSQQRICDVIACKDMGLYRWFWDH